MPKYTLAVIKSELRNLTQNELIELCLSACKFKAEVKDLIGFKIFDSNNTDVFFQEVKEYINSEMNELAFCNYWSANKKIKKISKMINQNLKISKNEELGFKIMLHLCESMESESKIIEISHQVEAFYIRSFKKMMSYLKKLHEDLQYDFELQAKELKHYDQLKTLV